MTLKNSSVVWMLACDTFLHLTSRHVIKLKHKHSADFESEARSTDQQGEVKYATKPGNALSIIYELLGSKPRMHNAAAHNPSQIRSDVPCSYHYHESSVALWG